MISPCRRHMLRQSAIKASQQAAGQMSQATGYELMLQKLNADKQMLHKLQSFQAKAELKRKLLPEYAPWVSGVLAEGNGAQDAILMTVMIWRIDAGDIAGALSIARYAFKYMLAMPFGTRTAGCAFTEEVIDLAARARAAGEAVSIDLMLEVLELTEAEDMPDKVRAQLHKIIGYLYRDGGKDTLALERLKNALILDEKSGVKKDIERLGSAIKKASVS
ncbi:MAG: phage terminase small subunit [Rouxiella aceris]|uniref:phage terminase small subunit n=1 Tax=Rouxiella aceris TaxID=2703884 RepID=UPI00284B57E8|nr:phage terminase small subunit [Rouxiella aceris]MDR3434655.1 phage terminase small subunit [Rouxiella aceris]